MVKKILRIILSLIFISIFCVSGFTMYKKISTDNNSEQKFKDIREELQLETEESIEETSEAEIPVKKEYKAPQSLIELKEQYPDVVGYIDIKDTNISYPILQKLDDYENDYYLHRDIDGTYKKGGAGCIYLDSLGNIDGPGLNLIYGHHMRNGSMFHDIAKYSDKEFMDSHQDIVITTYKAEHHLKPVYYYSGAANGEYRTYIGDDIEKMQKYLKELLNLDITDNNVYILITCTYDGKDHRGYLIATENIEN